MGQTKVDIADIYHDQVVTALLFGAVASGGGRCRCRSDGFGLLLHPYNHHYNHHYNHYYLHLHYIPNPFQSTSLPTP